MQKEKLSDEVLTLVSSAGMALAAFFAPIYGLITLIVLVSLVDHVFGVWRVLKLKEKFSFWQGTVKTLSKIVVYNVLIGTVFFMDHFLINEFWLKIGLVPNVLTKLLTLALSFHEWKSINRNFKEVKGVSIWDRILELIRGARKIVEEGSKIKKALILIISISIISACSPIYRHERLVNKFPYLHQQDTIISKVEIPFKIPEIRAETTFRDIYLKDTLFIMKDRLEIKYFKQNDSIFIQGKCKELDTIFKTKIKSLIRYYPRPVKWYESIGKLILFSFGFSITWLIIGLIIKKYRNERDSNEG